MPLALPSLLLAALLGADAPPSPCGESAFFALPPVTPLPAPPLAGEPPAWCPPDFDPGPAVSRRLGENSWVDKTHAFVEGRLFAPVLRLDRFFSDEKNLEEQRARSFLRWRTELRFDGEAKPALVSNVRADLKLPGLNMVLRRARFVIEGQTREAIGALLPDERDGQEGRGPGAGAAELRFDLWKAMGARADLGAGLVFAWPPGAFVRARLRWRWNPVEHLVGRSALSGFWRTDTEFGTQLQSHLERPFQTEQPMLVRLSSNLLLTEVSRGLEWTPGLTFVAGFGKHAAAALGAVAYWTSERSEPGAPRLERYKLGLRLRRDFFRRWFFLELEPEVYWPWSPELGRHAVWATTLRVEVQFRGIERRRPPPGAPVTPEAEDDDVDEGARDVAPPVPQR